MRPRVRHRNGRSRLKEVLGRQLQFFARGHPLDPKHGVMAVDPVDAREPAESTGWLSPKSQGRRRVLDSTTVDGSCEILHHQFGMAETL